MKLLVTIFSLSILINYFSQETINYLPIDSAAVLVNIDDPYSKLVNKADELFDAQVYLKALELYERAATINPTDESLPDKIQLTQNKLTCGNCNTYEKVIFKADNYFQKGAYDTALKLYERSQVINPTEAYPQEMIDEIKVLWQQDK